MGYEAHDGPGPDTARALPAFRRYADAVRDSNGVRYADAIRYADSGSLPDRARPAPAGRFPRAGWYPDADTGIYPVLDGYPGCQGYAGEPPAAGADRQPAGPPEIAHDPAHPAPAGDPAVRTELAGSPAAGPQPGRLARLRPDRWIVACGGLAATVAVVVAFATAGGSPTANTARTAQTAPAHAALPGCASPGAGR